MELEIKGTLRLGYRTTIRANLSTEFVSLDKTCGGLITNNFPVPCDRCKKTVFCICKDGDDYIAFCNTDSCLEEDCAASRKIANEERIKNVERNKNGVVVTGAEKFHLGSGFTNACLSKWMASKTAQNSVSQWMKNDSPFLIILGNPGTGKTYASASVLN